MTVRIEVKDLVQGALISDEPCATQTISGIDQDRLLHGQTSAQALVGVVTKPISISNGDQEEIKGRSRVGQTFKVVIPD